MYKIGNYEFDTKEDCIKYFGIGRTRFYQYLLDTKSEGELLSLLEKEKEKLSFDEIPLNWEQILYGHVMDLDENLTDTRTQTLIESECIIGNFRKAMEEKLSTRQKKIILQRFRESLVFADIAKNINISASRAHQIMSESIGILKESRTEYLFSLPDLKQTIENLEAENRILKQNLERYDKVTSEDLKDIPDTGETKKYRLLTTKLKNNADELALDIELKAKTIAKLDQEIDLRKKTIWKQRREINKFDTSISNTEPKLERTDQERSAKEHKNTCERIKTKDLKEELGLDRSNLTLFAKYHNVIADDNRSYTKEQVEWMRDMVKNKKHYISHSFAKKNLGKSICDPFIESGNLVLPVDQELVTNQGSLTTRFMTVEHFEAVQKKLDGLTKN